MFGRPWSAVFEFCFVSPRKKDEKRAGNGQTVDAELFSLHLFLIFTLYAFHPSGNEQSWLVHFAKVITVSQHHSLIYLICAAANADADANVQMCVALNSNNLRSLRHGRRPAVIETQFKILLHVTGRRLHCTQLTPCCQCTVQWLKSLILSCI